MQANWSIMLNVLLLISVVIAIGRLIQVKKQNLNLEQHSFSLRSEKESQRTPSFHDDIIAVRKINPENSSPSVIELHPTSDRSVSLSAKPVNKVQQPKLILEEKPTPVHKGESSNTPSLMIMLFLLAKNNRLFAGYELLQTVLAAGLRFGEDQLFHRHQSSNGQGPIICSLAAATETGVFDLQNIGAFSVRGLCLFMDRSHNSLIDEERFSIMLDTARQLGEGMDAVLLDDQRNPLTEERLNRYYGQLRSEQIEEYATA